MVTAPIATNIWRAQAVGFGRLYEHVGGDLASEPTEGTKHFYYISRSCGPRNLLGLVHKGEREKK